MSAPVVEVALTTNELHAAEAELETALRRMPAAWRETHHGRQVERAMLTMRAVRLLAARHGVER